MSRTVTPAKPRTAGAFGKPLTPSPELAAVVGAEPLARTAVVSKLWDYIRLTSCRIRPTSAGSLRTTRSARSSAPTA